MPIRFSLGLIAACFFADPQAIDALKRCRHVFSGIVHGLSII
jgi:hypothetical protein